MERVTPPEEFVASFQRELQRALSAREEGNEGMVRVCARRAAAVAIRFWLQSRPDRRWDIDALRLLQGLAADPEAPEEARGAAARLSARITPQFLPAHPDDPVDDALLIVRCLSGDVLPPGRLKG